MKTQHTPGPWNIGPDTTPDKLGMRRTTVIAQESGNLRTICIVSGNNGQAPGAQAKANARLIAAAPELLEALLGVIEYAENEAQYLSEHDKDDGNTNFGEHAFNATNKAREVINKIINP